MIVKITQIIIVSVNWKNYISPSLIMNGEIKKPFQIVKNMNHGI
jgi:hypothetical protein